MGEPRRIDIAEFRSEGYVQEVNRRLLHPLGLALEVVVEDDGSERLGGVWDYRDDPEGILYERGYGREDKAHRIDRLWTDRQAARVDALGYMIQPTSELES